MDEQTISTDSDDTFTAAERAYLLRRIGELGYPSQEAAGRVAGIKQSEFSKLLHGRRPAKRVYRKTLLAVLGPTAAPAAAAANVPRPVDTPIDGVSSLPGLSLEGSGAGGGRGRDARASSPVGALRPGLVRIYREGVQTDPFRPGDGTRDTTEERPLAFGHERDFVGDNGFGVELGNATLANWEAGEGRPLRSGWIVWCKPIGHEGAVDGHLVVVVHPRLGLRAGVYRQDADGPYIETDDPEVTQQERERVELEWVAGPVVYATTGGAPQRRANRRPADGADPTGHTFLTERRGQPNTG